MRRRKRQVRPPGVPAGPPFNPAPLSGSGDGVGGEDRNQGFASSNPVRCAGACNANRQACVFIRWVCIENEGGPLEMWKVPGQLRIAKVKQAGLYKSGLFWKGFM